MSYTIKFQSYHPFILEIETKNTYNYFVLQVSVVKIIYLNFHMFVVQINLYETVFLSESKQKLEVKRYPAAEKNQPLRGSVLVFAPSVFHRCRDDPRD